MPLWRALLSLVVIINPLMARGAWVAAWDKSQSSGPTSRELDPFIRADDSALSCAPEETGEHKGHPGSAYRQGSAPRTPASGAAAHWNVAATMLSPVVKCEGLGVSNFCSGSLHAHQWNPLSMQKGFSTICPCVCACVRVWASFTLIVSV